MTPVSRQVIIGLDVGTTGVKAVAFGLGSPWRTLEARWWVGLKDYLLLWLAGPLATDVSSASGTGRSTSPLAPGARWRRPPPASTWPGCRRSWQPPTLSPWTAGSWPRSAFRQAPQSRSAQRMGRSPPSGPGPSPQEWLACPSARAELSGWRSTGRVRRSLARLLDALARTTDVGTDAAVQVEP